MLHVTGERTLEKYRIFPYIAWILFIGFALFLYTLVMQLQAATMSLEATSISFRTIDDRVQSNEDRIEALEAAVGVGAE